LADLAGEIEDLSIAQIAAGLDPMDDTTWLESLHVPYKIFELANSQHDMGGAGPEFQKTMLDAIRWTISNDAR